MLLSPWLQVLWVQYQSSVWPVALHHCEHVCGCGHRHRGRLHKTENYFISPCHENSTGLIIITTSTRWFVDY